MVTHLGTHLSKMDLLWPFSALAPKGRVCSVNIYMVDLVDLGLINITCHYDPKIMPVLFECMNLDYCTTFDV